MDATLRWIGQSGFILTTGEGSLAVDPFCGKAKGNATRIYPPIIEKGSVRVDMVLTTHVHWDHFDPVTYAEYVLPDAIVGPGSCMKALQATELCVQGIELNCGDTLERCGFHITAASADHHIDSVGYVVSFGGLKLYFSGDARYTAQTIAPNVGMRPDIAFVCINGKLGNMNFREAASYCGILGAKIAVPTHYDLIRHNTENPKEFTDALAGLAPEVCPFVMQLGRVYPVSELLAPAAGGR